MKKVILLTAGCLATLVAPMSALAFDDDIYYNDSKDNKKQEAPKKEVKAPARKTTDTDTGTLPGVGTGYYFPSNRYSVDETGLTDAEIDAYNRRGYFATDSVAVDSPLYEQIATYVYPEAAEVNIDARGGNVYTSGNVDLTVNAGYGWADPWPYGYYNPFYSPYYTPYYYSPYYYSGWYAPGWSISFGGYWGPTWAYYPGYWGAPAPRPHRPGQGGWGMGAHRPSSPGRPSMGTGGHTNRPGVITPGRPGSGSGRPGSVSGGTNRPGGNPHYNSSNPGNRPGVSSGNNGSRPSLGGGSGSSAGRPGIGSGNTGGSSRPSYNNGSNSGSSSGGSRPSYNSGSGSSSHGSRPSMGTSSGGGSRGSGSSYGGGGGRGGGRGGRH